MTKLVELKAAYVAAYDAAVRHWFAADAADAARDAWSAYAAELKKTKEQTNGTHVHNRRQ